MSDENSTTVGNVQISQDDQSMKNQSGNDFMLDFGDGVNTEHVEDSVVETNSLEEGINENQSVNSIDIDFDVNDASGENKDESKIQGLENESDNQEIENKEQQNDFDTSLNDISNEELKENDNDGKVKEDLSGENLYVEDDVDIENIDKAEDYNSLTENLDNDDLNKNSEVLEDNESYQNNLGNDIENAEVDISDNERDGNEESGAESTILLDDDLEAEDHKDSINSEFKKDEKIEERNNQLENNEENIEFDMGGDSSNGAELEEGSDNLNENLSNQKYEEINNEIFDTDSSENKLEDNAEDIEQNENILINDDNIIENNEDENNNNFDDSIMNVNNGETENFGIENEEDADSSVDGENGEDKINDNIEDKENNNTENLDFVMDIEPEDENKTVTQPEIKDILEESSIELNQEDTINTIEKLNEEGNVSEMSNEIGKDNNQNQELGVQSSNSMVETFSYDLSDKKDETEKIIDEEKVQTKPENEDTNLEDVELSNSQVEAVNTMVDSIQPNDTTEIKSDNLESEQVTSTLSLDQILDSELNDNPDFIDNSKAVPNNVSMSSGLFANKKMVGIVAGVGVFLLAGFCAMLAFPFGGGSRGTEPTVNTGDVVLTGDHYSPDPEKLDENTGTIIPGPTTTIIPEEPEEPENPSEPGEPQPFIPCTDIDCPGEEPEEPDEPEEKLDAIYVSDKISSFKSQAERYYLKGDDMQDKKLIKYAAQAIHLCEVYQEQVENGEGLDEETLSSFKTKMNSLLNNMDKYLNGDDDTPTRVKSNYDDEYDFDGKDELLDYIYNGSSY